MFAIGLDNAKNPINIGHCLRAAHAYGASMLAVSGAMNHIPLVRTDNLHDAIPFGCVPVTVELHPRAENLVDFTPPPQQCVLRIWRRKQHLGRQSPVLVQTRSLRSNLHLHESICVRQRSVLRQGG